MKSRLANSMCKLCLNPAHKDFRQKSIAEIIDEDIRGKNEEWVDQYYFDLEKTVNDKLANIPHELVEIPMDDWIKVMQAQYPTLTDIHPRDHFVVTTQLSSFERIIKRDWTSRLQFKDERWDCDKFARKLCDHLAFIWGLTTAYEIRGEAGGKPHAFEGGVLIYEKQRVARLVEAEDAAVFIDHGPLGLYVPRSAI
jgi:hypothetical protein